MSTRRRTPTKPRGFQSLSTTTIEARPQGSLPTPPGHTPRKVVVTQLIDEDGAHWQREGDGDYEFIGWAPEPPKP